MTQDVLERAQPQSVVGPGALATPAETIAALRDQIADFLDYATDAALQPLLDTDLPFVGDALKNVLTDALLDPVKSAIDDALADLEATAATLPQAIADAVNGVGGPFSATVQGDKVRIFLTASDSLSVSSGQVDLDVGYDALGFELQGGVSGALGYQIDAELVFDTDTGRLSVANKAGDVISLSLDASLDEVAGSGSLGFLNVDVNDKRAAPEIQIDAGVDIAGGLVNNLTADSLTTEIDGSAVMRFGLAASLDGADPGDPSPLPRLFTDLVARYDINDFDPASGLSGLGTTPTITLEDMELDVGTLVKWLGEVLSPITERIFGAFALDELLDAITAPLPLIDGGSKAIGLFDLINIIDDNRINLLDLAAAGAPESKPVIEAFSKAYNLIKGIAALADGGTIGSGRINFGDTVLVGDAPAGLAMALAASDYLDQLRDVLDDVATPDSEGLANGGGTLADLLEDTGFSIPLLEDPAAIIGLFLNGLGGEPIDLVRYDVPELAFQAGFSQFFPIVGPIGVGLYGEFGAGIDIEIGYDTAGLQNGNLAEGFFITTEELAVPRLVGNDTIVYYDSAGAVDAEIGASAGINVGIAEVSVGGGVFAGLDAYFEGATTEGDGKLRLSDLSGCMFDPIAGEFGVKVFVKFRVGIGPFSFTKRFDVVKVTLANFEFGCEPETDPNYGLATFAPGVATLTLNAGDRADKRRIEGQVGEDEAETYVLGAAAGGAITVQAFKLQEINGHPGGGETKDDNQAVNLIVGHMGDDNDQVAIAANVQAIVQLWGDDGSDLLTGGAKGDTLRGGEDDDRLMGQGGADTLEGGDGDDVLEGGTGADTIDGGDDFDQVTYENSKVGVIFRPSADDEDVFVGQGGDAQGDRVTDVEHIIGSHFNDVLYGDPDDGGILEGLDGNDTLVAGEDDDLLIGGGGADTLYGGDGDDTISFVTSSTQVIVNLQTGRGSIGDAEGDRYYSIEHASGGAYDDVITGNGSDNKIDGWAGDDILTGGGGEDEIFGGSGDDLIYGSADGGYLSGGGTANNPEHDVLSYAKVGFGVEIDLLEGDGDDETARAIVIPVVGVPYAAANYSTFEDLTGSAYNDILRGDYQDNRIEGGAGNDSVDGSEGNDVLVGGLGSDFMAGGGGRDLADYSGSTGAVTVDLQSGAASGGYAAGDFLSSIENLTGSRYADTLTGSSADNRLDPGLTNSSSAVDQVNGVSGNDTLVLNFGVRDIGSGVQGGFATSGGGAGTIGRRVSSGTDFLDRVSFQNIDRIELVGTVQSDIIVGGGGNDIIQTNEAADLIYTGRGFDRAYAGSGNDIVVVGNELSGQIASIRTANFGDIRGGSGIDYYAFSLADATDDLVLTGLDGSSEFWGVNYANGTGSAISEFEVMLIAQTGSGDDRIVQPGVFLGNYSAGFGVDVIDPGQGTDTVDGGQDFRLGTEVKTGSPGATDRIPLYVLARSDAEVFANDGDLLKLDYRKATQGLSSVVRQEDTGYSLTRDGSDRYTSVFTNDGTYAAGSFSTTFTNIERVEIRGTGFGDEIIGTNLTYGLNQFVEQKPGTRPDASLSLRGDDLLFGFAGNDTIVGGSGDDTIDGGAGDDVIIGSEYVPGRGQPQADLGEVDSLRGAAGRDVFVLGNGIYSFYDDQYKGATGWQGASTDNRAVIRDFTKGEDRIVLSALGMTTPAAGYVLVEREKNTYIYLADGIDESGAPAPRFNELVAEVVGVTGLDLKADYFVYSAVLGPSDWLYGDGSVAPSPMPAGWVAPDPAALPAISPEAARAAADPIAAALAEATPAPVAAAAADDWITQTTDIATLDAALWGGKEDPFYDGILTIEGYGAAVGTFKDDPFGLGQGVIISTGKVTDLAGRNLVDGGLQPQQTVDLAFEDLGVAAGTSTRIFRANLSGLGFDINSLRLGDSGTGFGGSPGRASGFDIDAVALSRTRIDSFSGFAEFNAMSKLNVFSFDVAHSEFNAGSLRPPTEDEDLISTINGLPNFGRATLDVLDSAGAISSPGYLSIGDGGSLGLNLTDTVSTEEPLYLYVAEVGANGETITSGFTASAGRLEAPTDLSTDLGAPGGEDDKTALVYRFNGRGADRTSTAVAFDFVFFSEEFAEFAQSEFNDKFKITLNGVNLTQTSSGAFGSVSTIYTPPAGPSAQSSIYGFYTEPLVSDYIGNPVNTGPLADRVRADGYTRTLTFTGDINPGVMNELRIEVKDTGDGLLDSGLLISGKLITDTQGEFVIDRVDRPIREGEERFADFGITLPEGAQLAGEVTVTFRPDRYVDLGAGAGVAITETLSASDLNGTLRMTVIDDRRSETSRVDLVRIEVAGLAGTDDVAPLALTVIDKIDTDRYVLGDAPVRFDRDDPEAWAEAWSHDGVAITHSANARTAAPTWSAVSFTNRNPTRLPGGDIYRGDLGVSGVSGSGTDVAQDLAGREGLRFQFKTAEVDEIAIDFARFDAGDAARVQFLDADGELVLQRVVREDVASFTKLGGVQTMIVTAAAGGFQIDSVEVLERGDLSRAFAVEGITDVAPVQPVLPDPAMQDPMSTGAFLWAHLRVTEGAVAALV